MLFLLFQIGPDRYALPASQVVEVLPLVNLKTFARAPAGVSGVFSYHGQMVPAVDLSQVVLGQPAAPRVSTRIILVNCPDPAGRPRHLGLIAERSTETFKRAPADFVEAGLKADAAPCLGRVARDARGLIQWVELERLLAGPLLAALQAEPAAQP